MQAYGGSVELALFWLCTGSAVVTRRGLTQGSGVLRSSLPRLKLQEQFLSPPHQDPGWCHAGGLHGPEGCAVVLL